MPLSAAITLRTNSRGSPYLSAAASANSRAAGGAAGAASAATTSGAAGLGERLPEVAANAHPRFETANRVRIHLRKTATIEETHCGPVRLVPINMQPRSAGEYRVLPRESGSGGQSKNES